jgi:nucleotide-binding universal stress UspA family protein
MGTASAGVPHPESLTQPVLVAVEDSATGLQTAAVAVQLAAALCAPLVVVHVAADGTVDAALRAAHRNDTVVARRGASAAALLQHVARLARAAGVTVETLQLEGDPAPRILAEARHWSPALIVIGRSEGSGTEPLYVGAQARHVLEFAEQPVVVVPLRPQRFRDGQSRLVSSPSHTRR